jgi:hypothetical protein
MFLLQRALVEQGIKKTLRVDLTRIIVGTKCTGTVQVTTQRDSTRKVYFYSHVFVSNQQACGLIRLIRCSNHKQSAKITPRVRKSHA